VLLNIEDKIMELFYLNCDTWCRRISLKNSNFVEMSSVHFEHVYMVFASIQFKCRLIRLMLKQFFFRKHDFAAWVHQIHYDHQGWHFWQLKKIN